MDHLKFSQLLCSRLCHDLISPVGAINNGFEVLEDCDPQDQKDLFGLVKKSAAIASQRLIFYRSAFGCSEVYTPNSFKLLKELITNYLQILKIDFSWVLHEENKNPEIISDLFPIFSKLILNVILLGSEGMPQGGKIKISNQSNVFWELNFEFQGKTAVLRPDILKVLNEKEKLEDINSSIVQVFLIKELAKQLHLNLKTQIIDTQHWQLQFIS